MGIHLIHFWRRSMSHFNWWNGLSYWPTDRWRQREAG